MNSAFTDRDDVVQVETAELFFTWIAKGLRDTANRAGTSRTGVERSCVNVTTKSDPGTLDIVAALEL